MNDGRLLTHAPFVHSRLTKSSHRASQWMPRLAAAGIWRALTARINSTPFGLENGQRLARLMSFNSSDKGWAAGTESSLTVAEMPGVREFQTTS